MASEAIIDDSASHALAINQAHGDKIDASIAIRQIADSVRNQIAADAGRAQGVAIKANRFAQEKISKVAGRAQSAIDGVIADVGQGIRRTIEGAIAPLMDLGIELPSERQIQEIKRQLIVPPKPQLVEGGGGVNFCAHLCEVHRLDPNVIGDYDTLAIPPEGGYAVYPHGPLFCEGDLPPKVIRVFPKWWQAELACRLLTECKMSIQDLIPRWRCIDNVLLAGGNLGPWMKRLCSNFIKACDEWLALHDGPSTAKPLLPGELAGTTGVLPDGYCWWCDELGGRHVYPCSPETYPMGWKRC